jgi:excisionase family DNA binding protein
MFSLLSRYAVFCFDDAMSVRKLPNLDPVKNPTMTVEELAELLGTGRTATYDAIRANDDIPVIRVGRKILIPTAAIRRLLELDGPVSGVPESAR